MVFPAREEQERSYRMHQEQLKAKLEQVWHAILMLYWLIQKVPKQSHGRNEWCFGNIIHYENRFWFLWYRGAKKRSCESWERRKKLRQRVKSSLHKFRQTIKRFRLTHHENFSSLIQVGTCERDRKIFASSWKREIGCCEQVQVGLWCKLIPHEIHAKSGMKFLWLIFLEFGISSRCESKSSMIFKRRLKRTSTNGRFLWPLQNTGGNRLTSNLH